jgi:DNA invertase Pin-like site-specific DNA recombinase
LKQRICRGPAIELSGDPAQVGLAELAQVRRPGQVLAPNSGARADRPTLAQVLDQLRPGDTLVVWKLDRLGRSLRHLVDTITEFAERGIGFRSLHEAIDTTTPGGKLVFHVLAALAEFECDL